MGTVCSSWKVAKHSSPLSLTQKQVEDLHELTHISRAEILEHHRQFLTISPTGKMNYSQFENQLQAMDAPIDGSRAIFKMIDNDNSGFISFREYILSLTMFCEQSQPEQQLGAIFDTYQALSRRSQEISSMPIQGMRRNDIEHMLVRVHPDLSKKDIGLLCDRYMVNDQNKNGSLSKQEFIMACMKNSQLMEQLGHKDAILKDNKKENDN